MEKRKALGKGLQALIPEAETKQQGEAVTYINVGEVLPNRYQPREDFNEEKLNELIASIREKGVVQPLLVRRVEGGFELIAGERRLRAMKKLGVEKAPVILKNVDDVGAIELSLVENIQREELNPIEEAHAYKRLMEEFGFTQERIAQTIGKDRTSVTNTLRLLSLPLEIQRCVVQGQISSGHARAILSVKGLQQRLNLCKKVIKKGLSVRETEALARPQLKRRPGTKIIKDQHLVKQEEILQNILATKVRIHHSKKRGKIIIEYYSSEDLDRIINKIKPSGQ
ncbi:MAG: ParB/RepB/Spo0J family partition protein [Candidatus Omnitrophota bacterium]|nr:MAG: ParB/RepB/Spo0J family partition protein [Candidatus Omnitrophota bacterium]